MPTLQEALKKAINEWTEPEDLQQENKMSKSEIIFNYIRDNEGCVSKNVIDAMYKQGIKTVTTETMIGQFIKVGMVVRDPVCSELFAKADKYIPVQAFAQAHGTKLHNGKKKKPVEIKRRPVAIPEPKNEVPVVRWNIEGLLRDISLQQAKALYVELHKYFGGTL